MWTISRPKRGKKTSEPALAGGLAVLWTHPFRLNGTMLTSFVSAVAGRKKTQVSAPALVNRKMGSSMTCREGDVGKGGHDDNLLN